MFLLCFRGVEAAATKQVTSHSFTLPHLHWFSRPGVQVIVMADGMHTPSYSGPACHSAGWNLGPTHVQQFSQGLLTPLILIVSSKTHFLGSSKSPYLLPMISTLCSRSWKNVSVSASSLDLVHTLQCEIITHFLFLFFFFFHTHTLYFIFTRDK